MRQIDEGTMKVAEILPRRQSLVEEPDLLLFLPIGVLNSPDSTKHPLHIGVDHWDVLSIGEGQDAATHIPPHSPDFHQRIEVGGHHSMVFLDDVPGTSD